MKFSRQHLAGFTLTEMIVVVGIISILGSFISVNMLSLQHRATINNLESQLLADLQHTRFRAMAGTDGVVPHGIHFATNEYTLFSGTTYNASDPNNVVTQIADPLEISAIGFSGGIVVFASVSGEIINYSSPSATLTIRETNSGLTKTFQLNQLGTVTNIQ